MVVGSGRHEAGEWAGERAGGRAGGRGGKCGLAGQGPGAGEGWLGPLRTREMCILCGYAVCPVLTHTSRYILYTCVRFGG